MLETTMLETTWFFVWGLLWAIYFMLDGFDLGVGMAMPFLARDEGDRKSLYRSIEPFWDGNEVWLITAGGVTFAAFPGAYAAIFSALYSPLMLILFALILRGAALALRPESQSAMARSLWDLCFILGSFLPSLLFGVAFANLLRGILLDGDGVYQGTTLSLLNPQGLLGGVAFVFLFLLHGTLWIAMKSEGDVRKRAEQMALALRAPVIAAVGVFGIFLLVSGQLSNAHLPSIFPYAALVAMVAPWGVLWGFISRKAWLASWVVSSVGIVVITLGLVAAMYPVMLPSLINPEFSVTIKKAASTPLTLTIMLGVALVFVPIVIGYQTWAYRLFCGTLGEEEGY